MILAAEGRGKSTMGSEFMNTREFCTANSWNEVVFVTDESENDKNYTIATLRLGKSDWYAARTVCHWSMNDSFAIPVMKLMRKLDVRSRKDIFSPAKPDVMPVKIRFTDHQKSVDHLEHRRARQEFASRRSFHRPLRVIQWWRICRFRQGGIILSMIFFELKKEVDWPTEQKSRDSVYPTSNFSSLNCSTRPGWWRVAEKYYEYQFDKVEVFFEEVCWRPKLAFKLTIALRHVSLNDDFCALESRWIEMMRRFRIKKIQKLTAVIFIMLDSLQTFRGILLLIKSSNSFDFAVCGIWKRILFFSGYS